MKYVVSASAGFVLASIIFVVMVIPEVRQNWWQQGRSEGVLEANARVHHIVWKFFPDKLPNCSLLATLDGSKPDKIDIVDCGSFKTLRIVNE